VAVIAVSRSPEPFASCHSEGAKRPKNLLFTPFRASAHQGKLREGAATKETPLRERSEAISSPSMGGEASPERSEGTKVRVKSW